MNIIIFGAAGFIGTNLVLELSKHESANLTLVDAKIDFFDTLKSLNLKDVKFVEAQFVEGTDFDALLRKQDVVYHLVSSTVPTTSNSHIYDELRVNVNVSALFFNACVRCNIKRVVFISSGGTVYGRLNKFPLQEDMPTYPINSYGLQKITIEKLLYLFNCMHGLDYRIVRLANPYGPYQRPNGVLGAVTTFIYKTLARKTVDVYGDGSVVRDFIYIDDAIKGILAIANDMGNSYKTYNLGSGRGISINELLLEIEKSLKIHMNIRYTPARSVDVPVNYLDMSRFESVFGKLNHIPLSEGILATADFMRKTYNISE